MLVVDDLAHYRFALARMNVAGLSLNVGIVDASEHAHAQGTVVVDAAHHKPDGIEMGTDEHGL